MLVTPDAGYWSMVKAYEGDFEYEEAVLVTADLAALKHKVAVPDYAPIARSFSGGIGRILAFHQFPLNLIGHMQLVSIAHTCAVVHAGRDPQDLFYSFTEEDHAYARSVLVQLADKLKDQYGGDTTRVFLAHGNSTLKELLQQTKVGNKRQAIIGVEAIFSAMITGGYSALETVASDLWITAMNRHPLLARRWAERNEKKSTGLLWRDAI
jgi:hypothetical protein